jgi:O-antigen ligase
VIQRLERFLASPERDRSVRERVTQYLLAWDLFASSPIVGVGLGHPFAWVRIDGSVGSDFTADTPLILPAKLGILGLAWITLLALAWFGFVLRIRRAAGATIPGLAMIGWAAVLVVLAWSGFPIEDKGFSFALMFLLALGFIQIEQTHPGGGRW